ncbi:DNA ligase D [Danxiaibacter flavus]|uniref:DNA ligase (ATP) n=1 Tax=Danxiaibacter flavus TaxID=3049108 RepID=A0ABV3ZFG1_9BACT|nr:DNA ligase D [Chitinophagaceae bacterium DXS]
MSLALYKKKRDFKQTKEPEGAQGKQNKFRFVVQRHEATRLHYDFRLELGGVLKSWAVPKGPSLNPTQKRLAVMVEDHPVDYITFKGKIPEGNYGAGNVDIWDHGTFVPVTEDHEPITEKQALAAIKRGQLKFALKGKKLKGEFALVRLKDDDKNWLLIKHKDDYAVNTIYSAENDLDDAPAKKNVASIRHGKAKHVTKYIKPMLASITKTPFDDKEWLFEIKWDGYRAIAEWKDEKLRFYSRNGIDFTERFPSIAKELAKLKHDVVLDGEVVLINDKNLPDFQKLQHYENHLNYPLIYYVFDILELEGKDTRKLPLTDRKQLAKKLLQKNKVICYCDHVEDAGVAFFNTAREKGLEGIIAKKKDSTYSEGYRSREWLKIKNVQSTEAVIAGYTAPRGSRKNFGSLILASKKGKGWQYRGHVGTGFSIELLKALKKTMEPLETDESPFAEKVPVNDAVTWLKPKLVADIAYTEVTRDGIFRHPAFLRLRDEKKVKNMNDESEAAIEPPQKDEVIKAGAQKITISNYRKIFWPDEGYTKGDVAHYYERMSNYILPHLKNRPLSLKRNPNGIRDEGFFHKDAGENAPSYAKVFPVESASTNKTIDYIVCNNLATLLYLANLGCIEINPWNSTILKPDAPTWMVIDIDPSPKSKFTEVVDVALATKEVMDKLKMECFCKTSGASGLHVYTPLKNKYDYKQVRDFAQIIAGMVVEMLPDTSSIERSLSKRGSKIYVDYLQNSQGQTLACAYSLRPKKGATVSTPLEWKEVNHDLHPSQFTIDNIFERVEKKGDLFSKVITGSNDMLKALKLIDKG